MKSKWFRLIAFALYNSPFESREIGIGRESFEKKTISGVSTYSIHRQVTNYFISKIPKIATTNKVLQRMRLFGLVKREKMVIGRLRYSWRNLPRKKMFWRGSENFWMLTDSGKRYYEKTKNETRRWLIEEGFVGV